MKLFKSRDTDIFSFHLLREFVISLSLLGVRLFIKETLEYFIKKKDVRLNFESLLLPGLMDLERVMNKEYCISVFFVSFFFSFRILHNMYIHIYTKLCECSLYMNVER